MKKALYILPVLILLSFFIPKYALATALPTSMSIISAKAVRNTVIPGDIAFVFHYNLVYTPPPYPTDSATNTILIRLYDTNGTTLLSSSVPYNYFDYGYGQGMGLFYFAVDPTGGMAKAYIINISGSAAFFDPLPAPYSYTLTSSDYSSLTLQVDNQALMTSYILASCTILEIARPLYPLHGATDSGIVLSAIGENYFRGALPGIQSIAPTLFFTQSFVPTSTNITYTDNLSTTYGGRLTGTDIMTSFNNWGTSLGTTGTFLFGLLFFGVCVALMIWTSRRNWGVEPGILGSGIILTAGAVLLGDTMMTLRIIMGFVAGILVMYMLFFKKA